MRDLLRLLHPLGGFQRVLKALRAGRSVASEGLWGASMAYFAAGLGLAATEAEKGETHYPPLLLLITSHVEEAEETAETIGLFDRDMPLYFPASEPMAEDELPDVDILSQRLLLFRQLLFDSPGSAPAAASGGRIIVAPVAAVLQQAPTADAFHANTLTLQRGDTRPPEQVTAWLGEREFTSVYQVEVPGEFCQRGGILDVFPFSAAAPYRVEYFGDDIESIRSFDPTTQASLAEVDACRITAVRHWGVQAGGRAGEMTSLFGHLPRNTWLLLQEPMALMERADSVALDEPFERGEGANGFGKSGRQVLAEACGRFAALAMYGIPGAAGETAAAFDVRSLTRFDGDLAAKLTDLAGLAARARHTVVFCNNEAEQQRLTELMRENDLSETAGFEMRIGRLSRGFEFEEAGLALVPHHELFRRYQQPRRKAQYRHTHAVDFLMELEPGDIVVHAAHGIGRFVRMELLDHEGEKREYLRIEYADRAELFVPASRIELVHKYVGGTEAAPPLSKLGGRAWGLKKERAAAAAQDLAAEMLALQAERESQRGTAFPCDDALQAEFEAAFIYEETEDQLAVNAEIKRDMESPGPMDRLLCGDVGYGKTELAMRAAFKAVMLGKQVAALVPTTVLAAQHYQTFSERMADYPIFVEMLSRFRTRAEQVRVLEAAAEGRVDIVIGTHRLIQPDVRFRELGLVIIDEEQRFGVEHKERLKRLRATVDVLTLTATPIPRTLHMSLLGLRDISSLNTPPQDRLAVHTRLWRFDPHKIRQAVLREMARDGQTFFVHNRVESIEEMARFVRELVPEARVLVAHGQMGERTLQERMQRFVNRGADVLVCTTIIESGLDIPNVNTIIINRAERFGLADLHQLRGRVGRYKHRAYAYLLVPPDRPVMPVAERRLKAIEEFAELGAGFRIAMRDLEIRGAGNILGREQHGHIAAVGYDMYCRLLEFAIRKARGEEAPARPAVSLSLGLDAFLPEDYVRDPKQRIELYRKLQRAAQDSEIDALQEELGDRFGKLPREAQNMLAEARLRLAAGRAAVRSIAQMARMVVIESEEMPRTRAALGAEEEACRQVDERTLHLHLDPEVKTPEDAVEFLTDRLTAPRCADRARIEPTAVVH